MKNIYTECLLTVIAILLIIMTVSLYHIERSLLVDFRPVRTYNIEYDVERVGYLTIMDEWRSEK